MRGDQCDGDFSAGETHREIFDAAALSKKLGLPWELKTDFVHPGFVNRPGYNCIELAPPRECDCFFERSRSGTRRLRSRLSRPAIRIFADDPVVGCPRNATRF